MKYFSHTYFINYFNNHKEIVTNIDIYKDKNVKSDADVGIKLWNQEGEIWKKTKLGISDAYMY